MLFCVLFRLFVLKRTFQSNYFMHEVIQKMIDSAKESGELTESQKDYILLKAKSLGQNVEDVEFLLAGIPKKERLAQSVHNYSTSKKCPNCGAIIPGFSFLCPECGFVFQNERNV